MRERMRFFIASIVILSTVLSPAAAMANEKKKEAPTDCKMPDMVDKLARRLDDGIKKKDDGKKTEEEKSYNTGWNIFIGWVKAKDECGDECKQAKAKNVGGWLNVGSPAHECVKAKFRQHKLVAD